MTIYLLKNPSEDLDVDAEDPYETHLSDVVFVPVLTSIPVNLEGLIDIICSDAILKYTGVIVTSQRAIDVLKDAGAATQERLLSLPCYTVGSQTARRLKLLGFHTVKGQESGNGAELARKMVDQFGSKQHFLFFAGEVHRDTLPESLRASGHCVDLQIVYRTQPCPLAPVFYNITEDDWVVFFSPSHIANIISYLISITKRPKIASIGPTTKLYLTEQGIPPDVTAKYPSAESLAEAIAGFMSNPKTVY